LLSDRYLYRFIIQNVISTLHLFLSTMAFKSEIGFYVGRTDMAGVSASGLVISFLSSLVIFLYLMDGGGTSKVVLYTVFAEVMVDLWKLSKILRPKLIPTYPYLLITDPSNRSEGENETMEYDRIATANVTVALMPALVGAGIYSLWNYQYRGWYR